MAELCELIGKKKVVTKAGRDYFTYYFARPFSDYELENGDCLGRALEVEGCGKDFAVIPGDKCELHYVKGFQDKALLADIKVVVPAKK